MSDYTSSIINKYGDNEHVSADIAVLNEIMGRQGPSLLIDCMAESIGHTCISYKLSGQDRQRLVSSLVDELKQALLERT